MIRFMPDWPAAMRRELAADYCDLTVAAFVREVFAGKLPAPITLGGKDRWIRSAIDEALLRSSEPQNDWRAAQPGLNGEAFVKPAAAGELSDTGKRAMATANRLKKTKRSR
jgi:predicted DNA-binding transcriptional regulator AlpA